MMKRMLAMVFTSLCLAVMLALTVHASTGTAPNMKAAVPEITQLLNSLQEDLKGVQNSKLPAVERQQNFANITENLSLLLLMKESTILSDAELEKAVPSLRFQTKAANIDGKVINIRIARLDSFFWVTPGTLHRYWSYVQWWDESSVHVQVLRAREGSTPIDFLVLSVDGKPTLLLAEYSSVYRPYPHVLSTWQLAGAEWAKAPMFGPNVVADDKWNLRIYDNDVVIESSPQKPLKVAPNAQGDGFVFSVFADNNEAIELRFKEGLVVREH